MSYVKLHREAKKILFLLTTNRLASQPNHLCLNIMKWVISCYAVEGSLFTYNRNLKSMPCCHLSVHKALLYSAIYSSSLQIWARSKLTLAAASYWLKFKYSSSSSKGKLIQARPKNARNGARNRILTAKVPGFQEDGYGLNC